MTNTFDAIATFYDSLALVVFGKKWKQIQVSAASSINVHNHVLIVGGGSGLILEHLSPHVQVTYLELSSKMMNKAKSRCYQCQVNFLNRDFLKWDSNQKFDLIYYPFFLDCFDSFTLSKVILKTKKLLNTNGELHVVDFQKAGSLRNFIVKAMYLFFRLVANLKSHKLQDIQREIIDVGFKTVKSARFFNGWVFHTVYLTESK